MKLAAWGNVGGRAWQDTVRLARHRRGRTWPVCGGRRGLAWPVGRAHRQGGLWRRRLVAGSADDRRRVSIVPRGSARPEPASNPRAPGVGPAGPAPASPAALLGRHLSVDTALPHARQGGVSSVRRAGSAAQRPRLARTASSRSPPRESAAATRRLFPGVAEAGLAEAARSGTTIRRAIPSGSPGRWPWPRAARGLRSPTMSRRSAQFGRAPAAASPARRCAILCRERSAKSARRSRWSRRLAARKPCSRRWASRLRRFRCSAPWTSCSTGRRATSPMCAGTVRSRAHRGALARPPPRRHARFETAGRCARLHAARRGD